MSTAEITAYLYGARCQRAGLPLSRIFAGPGLLKDLAGDHDIRDAWRRLGSDMFAYWVRRGMDEADSAWRE